MALKKPVTTRSCPISSELLDKTMKATANPTIAIIKTKRKYLISVVISMIVRIRAAAIRYKVKLTWFIKNAKEIEELEVHTEDENC